MEEDVVRELSKYLKWYERIIAKLFKKFTYKIYKIGIITEFNYRNKIRDCKRKS